MCRREESRLPPLPGARQPSCAAHWPHPHDARMASWPLCQHPAPKPVCQGDASAVLTQHPTLSISQARTTPVLAILPVHCPWALPLYGPVPSSPRVRDWLCSPCLWTHMGSPTSPAGSPKTHIHTLTSLPQPQSLSPAWVQGAPSSPKATGSLYTPLREPAEG